MPPEQDVVQHTGSAFPRPGGRTWEPLLAEPLRGQAMEVASLVAERLREPEHVLAIAHEALSLSRIMAGRIMPETVVFGFGGIALPCAYFARCFPEQRWDIVAHRYLDLQRLSNVLVGPALFSMTGGMAMLVSLLSENGRRYRQTLATLHKVLCEQVALYSVRPPAGEGLAERTYDLISGATGVLAYLLTIPTPEEDVRAAIGTLLGFLIWLAGTDQESGRARWYIPPQFIVTGETRMRHPDGYYNCGLAHGIPGPLAVLSLACQAGYDAPGLREAIRFLSDWMLQHQIQDGWGINWPDVIPLYQAHAAEAWRALPPTKAAWCYGAPGIARALWFAGLALEDASLCQVAIEAMEVVLRRPMVEQRIESPTLCHGLAGLLAIGLRFVHDTGNKHIREHIPVLVSRILSQFNPDFPLGFRDLEVGPRYIDQTAWLTGAPGTAMVLLAASLPMEPVWDRVLLLS